MFMRINRTGSVQIDGKQIVNAPVPLQYSGFASPFVGADSNGNIHVTFKPEMYSVAYAKYDASGNNLVPQKTVPSGATSPHAPSLAVSPNGIVHITYEDCRFGGEAISYARLLNDGTIDKDGIRMSEASWVCSGSTVCADHSNNVHAAFINKDQGAYHAKLDNFGNPLPQAPPTFLYKPANDFELAFPPTIHADVTGGVHVAWNSNSGGMGKLMYMKLDSNGNKLAAGFNGSGIPLTVADTVKGPPTITSDLRGTAYVFWADNRNGNNQVWYLPIQNGHENDTDLSNKAICLTKDASGTAKEPFAARDPNGQLHVVWSDNRDGNYEIYHMTGSTRGIELGMTAEEMYKAMYVHSEETRRANLTVRNLGGLNDTVHIDIANDFHGHKGWNAGFEAEEFNLGPREERRFWVSVTGPPVGLPNEYIDTKLVAVSAGDPTRTSTVRFRTYLLIDQRLRLDCGARERTVNAGDPASYTLTLGNLGDTDETVELDAAGPPDWGLNLSESRFMLDRGSSRTLSLTVNTPLSAMDMIVGVVLVRAWCVSNPAVKAEVALTTRIAAWQEIYLTADREEATVPPGGTAVFVLTLEYLTNRDGRTMFMLSTDGELCGVRTEFDSDHFMFSGGNAGYTVLTAAVPAGAPEGDRLAFRVYARDEAGSELASVGLVLTVSKVRALSAAAVPADARLHPGADALFLLRLANGGNGPETVRPEAFGLPAGWEAELSLPNGQRIGEGWNVTLGAGGTAEIYALVTSPAGALAGRYAVTARFSGGDGRQVSAPAVVEVLRVRAVTVFGADPTQRAEPGASVRFPLVILNRGNAPEELSLSWRGLPEGWPSAVLRNAKGDPVTLATVPAQSEGHLWADVQVPALPRESFAGLEVEADAGHGIKMNATLTVIVDLPDLAIVSTTPSKPYPRPGELVYVNVTVENRGRAPARGAVLACHRYGEAVAEKDLAGLAPGQRTVESFVWIPREGKNVLVFVGDSKDAVPEGNETGNTALMTKFVSGPLPGAPDRGGWIVAGAVAVLAIGGAAAALLLLARKKRPNAQDAGG
jgi:uncharacterized membrane protein